MVEPTNEPRPLDEIVVEDVASPFGRHDQNNLSRRNGTNVLIRRPTGSSTSEGNAVNNNDNSSAPSTIRINTNKGGNIKVAIMLSLINFFMEIASASVEQFVSPRMPISLGLSCISVVISILYLIYQIRAHKLRFQWKPVPWYYYPSGGNDRIFGNFPDMVLLVCGVVRLSVSAINYSFILLGKEAPIKVSLWALSYAICMVISNLTKKSDRKQQGGGRDTNQPGRSDTNQLGGSGGRSGGGGGDDNINQQGSGDDTNQPGGGSSGGGGGDTNQPGGSGGSGDTNQQDGGGDTNQPGGGGDMNQPGDGGHMPQPGEPDNDKLPPGYGGEMPQPGDGGDFVQYLSDEDGYDKEKSL